MNSTKRSGKPATARLRELFERYDVRNRVTTDEAEVAVLDALRHAKPGCRERDGGLFLIRTCWPVLIRQRVGPARRVLLDGISQHHALISSAYILAEPGRIFRYPRVVPSFGFSSEDVANYVNEIAEVCSVVISSEIPADILREDIDAPVLGTAVAGRADTRCTGDADFYEERVLRFCERKASASSRIWICCEPLIFIGRLYDHLCKLIA